MDYKTEVFNNPDFSTGYSPNVALGSFGLRLMDYQNNGLDSLKIFVHGSKFLFRGVENQYQQDFPIYPQLVITHTHLKDQTVAIWNFENVSYRDDFPAARSGTTGFCLIFNKEGGEEIEQQLQTNFDLPDFLEQTYRCLFDIKVAGQRLWRRPPEVWMPVIIIDQDKTRQLKPGLQTTLPDGSIKPTSVWIWKREENKIHHAK